MEKKKGILQVVKYFLIAASAGIIQTLSFSLLEEVFHMPYWPSYLISLVLSVLWNFTFNRKFTFKDAGNVPIAMALAFLFYVPFYPFQIWYIDTIEKAIIASTGGKLEVLPFIVAQGTCMVYNFILEFLWQKFVVFRKPKKNKE